MQVRQSKAGQVRLWLSVGLFGLVLLGMSPAVWAWQPQVVRGRCKNDGNRCNSTIGNAGGQGACCDPQQRDLANCAQTNPCTGGSPYRWAESKYIQGLTWYFNPNNMPGQSGYQGFSETQILNALKAAWDVWSKPTCTSFKHKYAGKNSSFISTRDNQNTMLLVSASQWAQMGAGASTLAFTRPAPQSNGLLLDSDVVFNPTPGGRGWGIGQSTPRFGQDFIHVAAHEIGHAIGFGHSVQQKFLMYYASRPGPFPGLDQDDINGLCYTYPKKNCVNDADCGTGSCLSCQNKQCLPKAVAKAPKACLPCKAPADCGNTASNICVRLEEGNRCAQLCTNDGCCPKGYRCADFGLQKACIPDTGKCPSVRCSNDSNCGPGEQCSGGTCQPKPVNRDPKTCTACTSDSQCGGNSKCVGFKDNKARCLQPCVADNFCPTGFNCSSILGGRYCTPPDGFCPCTSDSQCIQGEACKGGVCRPANCGYGCACTQDDQCNTGYSCIQTGQGGVCVQYCGSSTTYPKGSAGSACNNGQCNDGASCYRISGSQDLCMRPCRSNSDCTYGGRCYQLGGQAFCLCQGNTECRNSQACNKGVLGQFGGGACTTTGSSSQCPTGFSCTEVQQGTSICQPGNTGGPGAKCGGTSGGCKDGLQCVQTSQGATSGICIEDCTSSNQCKLGGQCVIQASGGTKFCGCFNQSQCTNGQKCDMVLGQAGICTSGGSSGTCNNNGSCDSASGENCSNCAADCACQNGETCQSGICRGSACGNGTCERDKLEDCGTCPSDCKCDSGRVCENNRCVVNNACGNGTCERDKLEDCGTCAADCKCDGGRVCSNSRCIAPPQSCGNNTCEPDKNENCGTCAGDCPCQAGQKCEQNKCVADSNPNNNNNTNTNPGDGGTSDGDTLPPPTTCGCETTSTFPLSSLLWLGLLGLWLVSLRRRHHLS